MKLIFATLFLFSVSAFASYVEEDESKFDLAPTQHADTPVYEYRVDENGKGSSYIVDPLNGIEVPVPVPVRAPRGKKPNAKDIKKFREQILNRKKSDLNFNQFPLCGCKSCYLNDGFASRRHPILKRKIKHTGRDVSGPNGTPILAIESGFIFVRREDPSLGYGRQLEIEHTDKYSSRYAHLSKVIRSVGYVEKGELIGLMGSSGDSTAPHLHLEVVKYGTTTKWVVPRNSNRARNKANKKNGQKQKNGNPIKINPNEFMNLKKSRSQNKDKKAKLFGAECNFLDDRINRAFGEKEISPQSGGAIDAGS